MVFGALILTAAPLWLVDLSAQLLNSTLLEKRMSKATHFGMRVQSPICEVGAPVFLFACKTKLVGRPEQLRSMPSRELLSLLSLYFRHNKWMLSGFVSLPLTLLAACKIIGSLFGARMSTGSVHILQTLERVCRGTSDVCVGLIVGGGRWRSRAAHSFPISLVRSGGEVSVAFHCLNTRFVVLVDLSKLRRARFYFMVALINTNG